MKRRILRECVIKPLLEERRGLCVVIAGESSGWADGDCELEGTEGRIMVALNSEETSADTVKGS